MLSTLMASRLSPSAMLFAERPTRASDPVCGPGNRTPSPLIGREGTPRKAQWAAENFRRLVRPDRVSAGAPHDTLANDLGEQGVNV